MEHQALNELQARQPPAPPPAPPPLPMHALLVKTRALPISALNKERILGMGGKDTLQLLTRSTDEKTKQQAAKALANLDSSAHGRK